MRIESPQIGWHGEKDRILSIDFHPYTNQVATAGSDQKKFAQEQKQGTQGCIKIWEISDQGKNLSIKILYGLSQASNNTNVIKFSPNGAFMASGSDDQSIVLWQKRENVRNMFSSQKFVRWSKKVPLNGHTGDVIDLAWTRNSKYIVSAGMDRRIFIWIVQKKVYARVLDLHEKFVQGIALDPSFQHIVSCSNDRTTRVWKAVKSKKNEFGFFCKRTLKRFDYSKIQDDGQIEDKSGFRIFADESIPTFFRRPDFSPDGELFILPAGQWQKSVDNAPQFCGFLFRKNFVDKPTLLIPTNGQPALVCQFCPFLFKKQNIKAGLFQQNYYMVFAIATSSSIIVYDTQSMNPLYAMGNYHYATITDLTWKQDRILAISSSDGYCSFMIFEEGELGQIYNAQGELAQIMKIEPFIEKKQQVNQNIINQQQKDEYRQVQGGGVKKRIIPKVIHKF